MYGRWLRNSFIYLLILVAIVAIVFTILSSGGEGSQKTDLDDFIAEAQAGNLESVEIGRASCRERV